MAIGANGNQISHRIYLIFFAYICQRLEVVNMYETLPDAIYGLKIKPTHCALATMMPNAVFSRSGIAFITIYGNSVSSAFPISFGSGDFFRELNRGKA